MKKNNQQNSGRLVWKSQIWERQTFEGSQAFGAFQIYRDLGYERSLAATAATVGKNISQLKAWSSRYSWSWRADKYDRHLDRRRTDGAAKAATEMGRRHAQLSVLAFSNLVEFIASGQLRDGLNANNFAKIFETVVRVERLARGVPDSIIQQKSDGDSQIYDKRVTSGRVALQDFAAEYPEASPSQLIELVASEWKIKVEDLDGVLDAQLLNEQSDAEDEGSPELDRN